MRTEKQTLAIMRNFGLKVLTGFRAQLQMLQSHRYHGGLPPVTEAEMKQLKLLTHSREPKLWRENTMRFTGGETS